MRSLAVSELRMGSGLLSLNRGIAGACGVAISAAILKYRATEHAARLGQALVASSYGQDQLVQRLTTQFANLGDYGALAAVKSHTAVHRLLNQEASLHSYHDMFLLVGWISVLCIVPTLYMRVRRSKEYNGRRKHLLDCCIQVQPNPANRDSVGQCKN